MSRSTKGKTYEEIYGCEKAEQLKKIRAKNFQLARKGKSPWNKGKKNIYSKTTLANISKKRKYTIKDYKQKHPEFAKIEKPFIDHNMNMFVKCFHCGERFIPSPTQLYERLKHLKHKRGNKNSYFYCSNECKNNSEFFNRKVNPKQKRRYKRYLSTVWRLTYRTIKTTYIKNIELRGQKYHLDHKYSIYDGFTNDVDPNLIAHKNNLEIINATENRKKNRKSSITLETLHNITTI